jgi:hypothetical protein
MIATLAGDNVVEVLRANAHHLATPLALNAKVLCHVDDTLFRAGSDRAAPENHPQVESARSPRFSQFGPLLKGTNP